MTLVLAITCKDGVVLASDRQVTLQSNSNEYYTAETQKIFPFGEFALWGAAGDEPDISHFITTVNEILSSAKTRSLTDRPLKERLRELARVKKVEHTQKVKQNPQFQFPELLIVTHQEYPMILSIKGNGDFLCVGKTWFENYKTRLEIIGNAQIFPRAVFEKIREVYEDFTLAEARLVALRLVRESIKENPLVGKGVDVWTIKNNNVTQMEKPELDDLDRLDEAWTNDEHDLFEKMLSQMN